MRSKQNVYTFAILAVLIGVGLALYNHSDQVQQLVKTAVASDQNHSGSDSSSDSKPSETRSYTDQNATDQEQTSVLNQSGLYDDKSDQHNGQSEGEQQGSDNSSDQSTSESDESRKKEQSPETDSAEEEETSGTDNEPEQETEEESDTNQNPVRFDLSPYSDPVRRRIERARTIYKRAHKHYSFVTNEDLSLQRRKSRNEEARRLFKKTMTLLDEIRKNAGSDQNIEAFFEHASEMYGKCYRRAKMWGAY